LIATGTPSSAPTGAPALLGGPCLGQRALGVEEAEGVELVGLDTRQQRFEDLDRRQAPFAVRGEQLARGQDVAHA
jgi:hypothetical protein